MTFLLMTINLKNTVQVQFQNVNTMISLYLY